MNVGADLAAARRIELLPASEVTPLRVLLTATSYPRGPDDWHGVFIRHMVEALARAPLRLAAWTPPGDLPPNVRAAASARETAWLKQLIEAGGISHLMRHPRASTVFSPIKLLRLMRACYEREREVDVYHVNWLQCALPLPHNDVPAVITVLGNDVKLLRLPLMRSLLRRVLRTRRVAICPNAEWMVPVLTEAFGDIAHIVPVSFGIDPIWYALQRAPLVARKWLVVTRLTHDKLGPLLNWSQRLFSGGERELHLFGPMQEPVAVPSWVHYHGPATPAELASIWFPQAAGLISLSRHAEGRPQVMLEAMAAGLPVVASPLPGHASLIEPGVTGSICNSAAAYFEAVQALEDPALNARFGAAARARMRADIGTWDDCAQRYISLYRQLRERG